jgi:hypothetical protein
MTDISARIRNELANRWIPSIYNETIRPMRTRSFELDIPEKENTPAIQFTLLGVELKVGRRRFACPDIGTARYLAIFARAGCRAVAVPYDITRIPEIASELEGAWEVLETALTVHLSDQTPQQKGRIRARVIRDIRNEVAKYGAGELMPLFNTSTRQRDD